jgi:hypothetical protein
MSTPDTVVTAIAGALPTLAALAAWHRAGKAERAAARVEAHLISPATPKGEGNR